MLANKKFGHCVYINPFSSEKIMKCLQFVMFCVKVIQILSTNHFDIACMKVILFRINVENVLVLINEAQFVHPS